MEPYQEYHCRKEEQLQWRKKGCNDSPSNRQETSLLAQTFLWTQGLEEWVLWKLEGKLCGDLVVRG